MDTTDERPLGSKLTPGSPFQSKVGDKRSQPNRPKQSEITTPQTKRKRKIRQSKLRKQDRAIGAIHGDDMRNVAIRLRERFYGLGEQALQTLSHALVKRPDVRLAYRLLIDIGAVPSLAERDFIAANREVVKKAALNEYESTLVGDMEGRQAQIMIRVARMAQERAKIYDLELPTPQAMRHNKAVSAIIDEICDGKSGTMSMSEPARWNSLKKIVENHLEGLVGEGCKKTVLEQAQRLSWSKKPALEKIQRADLGRNSSLSPDSSEGGGFGGTEPGSA